MATKAGKAAAIARIRKGAKRHLYLNEWFEYLDLSDQTVANRLEVSRQTVFRYRTGKRKVPPDVQARLADALGLDDPAKLWRPPPPADSPPSLDALVKGAEPELQMLISDIVRRMVKKG